jgi:CheY-like chemotaxis protein
MRVLIVDDDETFCQLLAEVLEGRGIKVVWTTDGLAGYEMSLYESSTSECHWSWEPSLLKICKGRIRKSKSF